MPHVWKVLNTGRVGLLYHKQVWQDAWSINQISIVTISPAKSDSVAQQPNQRPTAKSKKQFHNINRPLGMLVSMGGNGGKAKSKRCVFRCFLKVATEIAERTDSGRLFQRDGVQEWKALAPVLVLTLGTDRLWTLFDLRERDESDVVSMECFSRRVL